MQYCPCRSNESRFHARILKSPFKILLFGPIPIQLRTTGIFMAFSNRNRSTDLFYVIPFNAVAFVLTAEQRLLLANISNLFALIVLLCIDVSIHSTTLSPIQATLKRIIKIHNLASILIKTNGASGGQFGLWNNGVRCAAKVVRALNFHYSLF